MSEPIQSQAPYLSDNFWDRKHSATCERWLTGSRLRDYISLFGTHANPRGRHVLEVGCGLAVATKQMAMLAKDLWVVDISRIAIERARQAGAIPVSADKALTELPPGHFDTAISYLVTQHIHDWQVIDQVRYVLRALRPGGIFCVQFLTRTDVEGDSVPIWRAGVISRSPSFFASLVHEGGGTVLDEVPIKDFRNDTTENIPVTWNGYIVGRVE